MQHQTVPQTAPSELLADPGQVAIIRDLLAHARKVRAEHALYAITNGRGLRYVGVEHTFTAGESRVIVHEGWLVYKRRNNTLLTVRVTNARQVAQLLAAIGVIPERFIALAAPAAEPTNPDRRCRNCGATSGLRLVLVNPLSIAYREWECAAGCKGGAR